LRIRFADALLSLRLQAWALRPGHAVTGVNGIPLIRKFAALGIILAPVPAHAQHISADRPGIGSDPEVVPQYTLQGEVGTDAQDVRLGVLPGFELDHDNTSWSAKLALLDGARLKASLKLSYDRDLKTVVEVPANYTFTPWFNLGADISWSRNSQTYAAEFNFTPTDRLTITPTVYYDTRIRGAVFAAWIPKGHDNLQFDIGYDQHRYSAGISVAFNLAALIKKH
jgi:hypothetical protein